MDNVIRVRVNQELQDFYKGNPDKIKEALTMYKRAEDGFVAAYQKEMKKEAKNESKS